MAKPEIDANKRIKEFEIVLAKNKADSVKRIEEVAKLLKEVSRLEKELEQAQKQIIALRRNCKRLRGDKKIRCNREAAMVVYGEMDTPEAPN